MGKAINHKEEYGANKTEKEMSCQISCVMIPGLCPTVFWGNPCVLALVPWAIHSGWQQILLWCKLALGSFHFLLSWRATCFLSRARVSLCIGQS